MVKNSYLVALLAIALLGFHSCAHGQEKDAVGIDFEQTLDTVVFDFNLNGTDFSRVHYNTSVRNGETLVKVVLQSDTDQKFYRIHLARAVVPQSTSAVQTDQGAKITLSKADSGLWNNVVNFASEEALQATLPVTAAGYNIEITASEYEDVHKVIEKDLTKIEGFQYTEEDVQKLSSYFNEAFDKTTPYCVDVNFCICSTPNVFDGTKCVLGQSWESPKLMISSQNVVQIQEENQESRILNEHDLLNLNDESFNLLFDTYQKQVAKSPVWPYVLYAQTLVGARVLTVGAGLTQFESLVLARSGVNVTIIDSNLENLRIIERIAKLSNIPATLVNLIHVTSMEDINKLEGKYEAVIILDSLTGAPSELMSNLYVTLLNQLRLGGRWIQQAPSKSRYRNDGSPSYNNFSQMYNRHIGQEESLWWYEWLDLQKLMYLFSEAKARFQIIFNGEVGTYPNQYPDNFVFLDLMYLGSNE